LHLIELGFSPKRLDIQNCRSPHHKTNKFTRIVTVKDNNESGDTFCFNEPKKHMGIFNGILTGQCCEIIQYSSTKETAVCNLASINLSNCLKDNARISELQDCVIFTTSSCVYCKLLKFELKKYGIRFQEKSANPNHSEWTSLQFSTVPQLFLKNGNHVGGYTETYDEYIRPVFDFVELSDRVNRLVESMNIVINKNYYPTPECELSNFRHRPIGLGVQGLADLFCKLRRSFDSDEARQLNLKIFETIYFSALSASNRLVDIFGCYSTFQGSLLSKGRLHFDNCDNFDANVLTSEPVWDWEGLRKKIVDHGVCNSLLIAPMPTASTSQILNQNECIEPFTSNLYVRRTLAGEFTIFNKYLMEDLKALGIWNQDTIDYLIVNRGSVINFAPLPLFLRKIYRTAWEIPQKSLIEMASQRQWFIDQSQSFNLFVADPSFEKLTKMHFYGWKNGLKTGSYYVRTKPQHFSQNVTIDPTKEAGCSSCSA
jgi:ribonucleoside-diphosphate reductase alpha subunit